MMDEAPAVIVDSLIYESSIHSLGGPSKVAKSYLALQLAVCVATGHELLGLRTEKAPVLVISVELTDRMLQARIGEIQRDCGLPVPKLGQELHLVARTRGSQAHLGLLKTEELERLRALVAATGSKLVVLDTFYGPHPGTDPPDRGEMRQIYAQLHEETQLTGAAFVVVDHSATISRAVGTEAGRGFLLQDAAAQVVIHLRRLSLAKGGSWEIDVESGFRSWTRPIRYRRPKRATGEYGTGCIRIGAEPADDTQLHPLRDRFTSVRDRLKNRVRRWLMRRGYYLCRVGLSESERLYLEETSNFKTSDHAIRDKRSDTHYDYGEVGLGVTLTPEGLEDVLGEGPFRHKRVLEVGPKYGVHSLWMSENLEPSELVLCELPKKIPETERWRDRIECKHRWIYKSLLEADELLEMEPFDLVLLLGVLYHNIEPVRMLTILNRVTRLHGHMLLESTIERRPDAVVRLKYTDFGKMYPSVDGLRILLSWTGWRNVVQFTDYRPGSTEALFLCEKTHEVSVDSPEPHTSLKWD